MSGWGTPLLLIVSSPAERSRRGSRAWLLSKTTDALDVRLGLGEELGGLLLLALAGSLPEVAITVSAAAGGHLGARGRQPDRRDRRADDGAADLRRVCGRQSALSFLVGALTPVLEGLLVMIVVSGVLMGALLKRVDRDRGRRQPGIRRDLRVWGIGLYVINRARKAPRWHVVDAGQPAGPAAPSRAAPGQAASVRGGLDRAGSALLFGAACAVTLIAGVALEQSGDALATHFGVNGVIFGATILATASALPEISSGIAAVRLGDNALAMGDIFGGNAFQVCLFLLADLIAGEPVLPSAGHLNAWLAALGVALTAVYGFGVIIRPLRCLRPPRPGLAARGRHLRPGHRGPVRRPALTGRRQTPAMIRVACGTDSGGEP